LFFIEVHKFTKRKSIKLPDSITQALFGNYILIVVLNSRYYKQDSGISINT